MSLNTILVEDSKTIRENLIPAMAELADINVVAVAETPVRPLLPSRNTATIGNWLWWTYS